MSHEQVVVERVKSFLKWNPHRFESLDDKTAVAPLDPWGWRRNDEWWIKPPVWREQLCAGEFDPVETAQALRALDLVRTQDNSAIQAVVKVRGRTERAYVVGDAIFTWKPEVTAKGFLGYRPAQHELLEEQKAALIPTAQNNPVDLATLLQSGAEAALRKAIEVLAMSPDPNDRHYATVLRAQSAFGNTVLNTQLRVDEAKLRAKQADALLPALLESLKIEKEKLSKIEFRRDFDDGKPIGMGMGAPEDDEPSA